MELSQEQVMFLENNLMMNITDKMKDFSRKK